MRAEARPWWTVAILVLLCIGVTVGWWRDARPVPLPAAPTAHLECVSYSPSGATDGMPRRVAPERIRADLGMLADEIDCVRTYTVSHGLDHVPAIAREFGLDVLLGAWIGRESRLNEREIRRVIDVANEHRDVVRAIVVGNEVLLRHELPPAQLAAHITRVGSATGLPVTYADVWGFWVRHRAVAAAVDFVTVHIIPYWDDDPVGIDEVIPYVDALYADMRRTFPGKTVLIGETGWPSAGRPRGANVPGRVNQARYIREFTGLAQARGIPYNLIEAFDQPWKQPPEGTVGGYWGLRDVNGRVKFPLTGPVQEFPGAERVVATAVGLAVLGALVGALGIPRRRGRAAALLAATDLLAAGIGSRQWSYLVLGNTNWIDWLATASIVACGWLALAVATRHSLALRDSTPVAGGVVATMRAWNRTTTGVPLDRLSTLLRGYALLCAAYVSLGLVFAGRHRDFPVWLFLPAVIAIVMAAVERPRRHGHALRRDRSIEEVLLACWLVAAALLVPWLESFANVRSLAWGLSALALGLAVLVPLGLQTTGDQQPAQDPDP